jgi:hypothetical protein
MYSELTIKKQKRKHYKVVVAYAGFDSHGDKLGDSYDEPQIINCCVDAVSPIEAVNLAMTMVNQSRAEVMLMFWEGNPLAEGKESFTIDELIKMVELTEQVGVMQQWMNIQPTSIQVHLADDEKELRKMTEDNVISHMNSTADEVENYLKEINND